MLITFLPINLQLLLITYLWGMKKQSYKQYRNINGKHFIMWTSNPAEFKQAKAEIKAEGLTYRMVDGQLYKELEGSLLNAHQLKYV